MVPGQFLMATQYINVSCSLDRHKKVPVKTRSDVARFAIYIAVESQVKFQGDMNAPTPNVASLRLCYDKTYYRTLKNAPYPGFFWLCDPHDDVIKWKHCPRYWPFVQGIHRSPVNSPHKGQWRGALMFSLICVWINGWVNNREVGDLRSHRANYDVIVMDHGIHEYLLMNM